MPSDDSAADFLDDVELRDALKKIRAHLGEKLALVGFDACLMAMVEVAYQVRDCANVLVASQRSEPGDGWPYDRAFKALVAKPTMTAEELGRSIVRAFDAEYRRERHLTLSAIQLARIAPLASRLETLAAHLAREPEAFHAARPRAENCSPRAGSARFSEEAPHCTRGALDGRPRRG